MKGIIVLFYAFILCGAVTQQYDEALSDDYENTSDVVAWQSNSSLSKSPRLERRSLTTFSPAKRLALPAADKDGWIDLNVGVLMASHLDSPFDLERCGPAVDLALERVNQDFLQSHKIRLRKVQGRCVFNLRSLRLQSKYEGKGKIIDDIQPQKVFQLMREYL